ncbi:MAG: type II secretion system protein E [Gallionellales bacterium RIFCSPLOWO2_12_FULL_59_22]|nr:MAG: type II secretion system protein E [Gallionellales bacterium RIFCSPLOWO2_02_FULL_59_110]OGT04313.1 MAG: type II secretion system protein E [Gallionellales bacterium RIFCSPLOWO2_02_58_13]OGT09846.1 MAG: type II secretion system protein E [Gallionellales bacterium RIFCSPLOWO2_12_FULL_59_22]
MSKESFIAAQQGQKLTLEFILRWLVRDDMVADDEANRLLRCHNADRAHPLAVIGEQKWRSMLPPNKVLSVEFLTEWLAAHLGMPYFHIDPLQLNFGGIASIISKSYAERLKIMPVGIGEREITIATSEPFFTDWVADLERILNLKVRLVLASPLDINRYLPEIYSLASSVHLASKAKAGQAIGVQNFEQLVELGKNKNLDANEQHVVTLVDWLFKYAFEQRASDIHLEPRRDIGIVRFRIDGVLHQVYQLPTSVTNAITSRIKLLGRMDMVEKRRPQDGRIKTVSAEGDEVELRLSTMPTAFGEKLVMRIFDPEILVKNFTDLGFSREQICLWDGWTRQPNGIILVTGPTGSGKTTTLYSTLKHIATPEVNVCTVEDPIEMIEPAFNQMQVQHNIGLNFADGVRTLLRQDPDIIMVGEIRDIETAEMAIQAALTGHLVLSSLHTNDAPSAITRLLELGVPAYLLNSTLLGVMAQRLARTLCQHCKAKGEISDETWRELVSPWKAAKPAQVNVATGCLECRMTGYRGRTGIYEMLPLSAEMKKLIVSDAELQKIKALAMREGMKPLRLSGAEKVAAGLTTAEEIIKIAPPVD